MIVVAVAGLCLAILRANLWAGMVVTGAFLAASLWKPTEGESYRIALKLLITYCVVSSLTIPFAGLLWLGEVPLLALVQLPKIGIAEWLRSGPVMGAIRSLGLSGGSFSPDYILARPYALALVYLLPLIGLAVVLRLREGRTGSLRPMTLALTGVAVLDYVLTLVFGSCRSFTIY
jgi:hypothetical protein